MRSIGPIRLYATPTQQTYVLPAGIKQLHLKNNSVSPIRYAFVTGKVAAAPLPTTPDYETLLPGSEEIKDVSIATAETFYYASNLYGAEFEINPRVA